MRKTASSDNPTRILVIESQSEPGGMWHYASSLARALMESGLDVTLATLYPFEPLKDHDGVRLRSLGERPSHGASPALRWLGRALGQAQRWTRLHQIVHEVHPEIIHLHNCLGMLDALGLRTLQRLGIPIILTAHEPGSDGGMTRFDWARYRAADAIIVHSLNGVQDLARRGIAVERIKRIHHGSYLHLCSELDLSPVEARQRVGLERTDRVVLFFGTIAPYKGLDILIDAFARIASGDPHARLVIAGEPLEDFTPYRTQIENRGIAHRVVLNLKYIPFVELAKYFLSADLVAFPYRRSYQSGVLHLAYGYGRPVVVTDVGGLGEVVAEDKSGLVVPPGDPAVLGSAIHHLLQDKAAAEEMGRRGRLAAETKYSWHAVVKEIIGVYRGVFKHGPGSMRQIQTSGARGS